MFILATEAYIRRMTKRTLPDGTEYETFTSLDDMAVGQIVMIPDGRAGEITQMSGPILLVRPWDQTNSHMFWAAELQPWCEDDSCGMHPISDSRPWSVEEKS